MMDWKISFNDLVIAESETIAKAKKYVARTWSGAGQRFAVRNVKTGEIFCWTVPATEPDGRLNGTIKWTKQPGEPNGSL
jgi:hypothetical protein